LQHAHKGTGRLRHLRWERLAHSLGDACRYWLHQATPRGLGALDPLGTTPRARRAAGGGKRRGVVQPGLREPEGVLDLASFRLTDRTVASCRDDVARCGVGEVPVHRTTAPGQHLANLLEHLTEIRIALRAARAHHPEQAAQRIGGTGAARILRGLILVVVVAGTETEGQITHG
jgi:hypothetical protein